MSTSSRVTLAGRRPLPTRAAVGGCLWLSLSFCGLLLAGCTGDQLYASGRNTQRAQCLKLQDAAAQDRCLKDAGMSHDSYKKEADAVRR